MKHRIAGRIRGFSLLEVLVTILIIAIGFLGLAKTQAAAVSNTQVSRVRAIIALQTGSLASAMHGNREFWGSPGVAPANFSVTGTTIVDTSGTLTVAGVDCVTSICTPAQLALYDVQSWSTNMNNQFPGYSLAAGCSTTTTLPVSCTLKVTWNEKYLAVNRSTSASSASMTANQNYTLFVQP